MQTAKSSSVMNRCGLNARVGQKRLSPSLRSTLQVRNAISRERKTEIVQQVSEKLKTSSLVFGMSFKGLTVAQMEALRKSLPTDQASLLVCKNSLMKVAASEVEGWESLASVPKDDNAWIFVQEDGIASTVKAFLKFKVEETKIKQLEEDTEEKVADVTSIRGGALGGKVFTPQEIEKLESLPTKNEMIASIAGMLQSVPIKLTMALSQAPQSMAMRLDQIAGLDEDKTKKVESLQNRKEESS